MNLNWTPFLTQMSQSQGQGAEGNPYSGLIMLAIMFAIFYFLLIRPQQKRMKEHQKLIQNLEKGAEVVTNGGMLGRITAIADDFVTLQIADNVRVKIQKTAIQHVLGSEATGKKVE